MADHLLGRTQVLDALTEDLFGPCPTGPTVHVEEGRAVYPSVKASFDPHVTQDGQEILPYERPLKRYGVGVLFPDDAVEATRDDMEVSSTSEDQVPLQDDEDTERLTADAFNKQLTKIADRNARGRELDHRLDLSTANARRPSSMGISFLVDLSRVASLSLVASGGRYSRAAVVVGEAPDGGEAAASEGATMDGAAGEESPRDQAAEGEGSATSSDTQPRARSVFVRAPWSLTATFESQAIRGGVDRRVRPSQTDEEGLEGLDVEVQLFTRPRPDGTALVTASLINRTRAGRRLDEHALFQAGFEVQTLSADGDTTDGVLPYPAPAITQLDPEQQSLALLYRGHRTFAIGHGCAADWSSAAAPDAVDVVRAVALPTYQTPSITPEVETEDGRPLQISMRALAGLEGEEVGLAELSSLIDAYRAWIERTTAQAQDLDQELRPVAKKHLAVCAQALDRMRSGLALIERDPAIAEAFRLANHAILLQQLRSTSEPRLIQGVDRGRGQINFLRPYPAVSDQPQPGRGTWRPFQIAFILMNIVGISSPGHAERRHVDLIWFPTGGGKTEAYLGLAAFAIFLRRLRDRDDVGVEVIMRYTLRLLTAQQFQRASGLICAMEYLRLQREETLGKDPLGIGIWLGSSTTPNNKAQAKMALKKLLQGQPGAENPFLLSKCPWCAAEIGPMRKTAKSQVPFKVIGYKLVGDDVRFHCSDTACAFKDRLPVHVVDEEIYESRPDLLIGTVDKFAQLAWVEEARSLFGIDRTGARSSSPPGLIIQDELHLISGPLGSMVGLYEFVLEELCTDRRSGTQSPPKIVTSTATTRRYEEQVKSLYAREEVTLFPPPGIDAGDSFFATYARQQDGTLKPGRLYVGVHAGNHTSLITTQVQTLAALLQAPMSMSDEERDPWWTQFVFFNNLRELGTTLSLLQSNVPMHLRTLQGRMGLERDDVRRLNSVLELTGRLRNEEVPEAIAHLEVRVGAKQSAVDICLASNIIEVGIDIDRMSLMTVVGQPKTTSQYIQVTGRVGRRWWERPGLIVTLLNPNRARDRSHFEQFRSFHERLYAQVEPTSVTPFSPAAVDRALHGAWVAFIRQRLDRDQILGPDQIPIEMIEEFEALAKRRVEAIDPGESAYVTKVLKDRRDEWSRWKRTEWRTDWSGFGSESTPGLITWASDDGSRPADAWTWPTPTSLRNVDAECEAQITTMYAAAEDIHGE